MTRVRSIGVAAAAASLTALAAVAVGPVAAQSPSAPVIPPGTTVNLLTFNGPQVAEPLIRRAPDFEAATGIHVNVIAVPFQDIYTKAILDASTGNNAYDAYVFNPQWFGDFATPGYLEDLGPRIAADPSIQWDDIAPFFRDFSASYGGKTYAIPLDGDFHMAYYRKDLLDRDGIAAPKTWDDYLAVAEKYNGQDLNEDGTPDYGSCIAKKVGGQSYWWLIDFAAPMLQSQGTGQGVFFDTTNMDPLFNNDATKLALETYKKTTDFGPPDELNLDLGAIRNLFTTGRCALTLDWGDTGTLAPGTYVADKYASLVLPGSTQVWDQASGALVPCDTTTCPYAVDGVNHAPFAAFGGWSGAVNAAAQPVVKDAAYAFLSYMTAPAQSNVDVTIGASGFNPYRTSQFTEIQPWLDAGLSETAVQNYLGAIKDSLNSPNMVLDLRIPKTADYQQNVLDKAVASYLAGDSDEAETMQTISDGWNALTDAQGRDSQLAAYKASLAVSR
jgi:multiple sugar transport system substrate-binding protein